MAEKIDSHRRHLLGTAAMTMAAATVGMMGTTEAADSVSREFAAIGRATDWLNTPRVTAANLLGKVVVVDFCTYTCINWLRTLPYVRAWAQKYRQGLVVIGVHTPEFEFEKNIDNVRRELQRLTIDYPVVIDNDYSIWRAFKNQYWPALYFLDAKGRVRQHQFGEGEYVRSEVAIQQLLAEAGTGSVASGLVAVASDRTEAAADWANLKSPENYVGYDRTQNFASRGGAELDRRRAYAVPERLGLNQWALAGEWTMGRQATVVNRPGGRIVYRFHARDLHLVMGPPRSDSPVPFRVSIDGQPPGPAHGLDVDEAGHGRLGEQRLYQLVRQPKPILDRLFEIEFLDSGAEAFAFTFG